MKIVPISAKLVHQTPDPDLVTEEMGRICYQSEHKYVDCDACGGSGKFTGMFGHSLPTPCKKCRGTGHDPRTARDLIAKILANGHESVLEHVSLGVKVVNDRGYTHEQVRHRTGIAFSQESTRYCDYAGDRFGGDITLIFPQNMLATLHDVEKAERAREIWTRVMTVIEEGYHELRDLGVAAQDASGVLPQNLKSEIGITADCREWRHVMRLRSSPRAHPMMREAMSKVLPLLLAWFPQPFEEFRSAEVLP